MIIETEEKQERTVTKTEYYCDLCGNKIEEGYGEVSECSVWWGEGTSYPEGGHESGERFDFCVNCAKTKVFPLIREKLKISSRETYSDW